MDLFIPVPLFLGKPLADKPDWPQFTFPAQEIRRNHLFQKPLGKRKTQWLCNFTNNYKAYMLSLALKK